MNPAARNLLALIVGVVILSYIIHSLGPGEIMESLSKTRIDYFLLAALLYLINEFFAALALKIPTGGRMRDVMPAHMRGMLYSNATPGRVGYYYTAYSLAQRTEKSTSGNMGVITVIQGVNFMIKVVLCITAVIYFSRPDGYFLLISLLPLFIVSAIALIFYTNILNNIVGKLPLINRFQKNIELMQGAGKEINKKTLFEIITASLISWVFMSAQWYCIAHSIGAEITPATALLLQPLLTTVMFIPLSPAGLGLTEGGSAVLFSMLNFSQAAGVTFILLVRLNSILTDSLGFIGKLPKP